MTDLGLLTWYLGMQFIQHDTSITIDQSQYVKTKLQQFQYGKMGVSSPLLPDFQQQLDNDEGIIDTQYPYRSAVGSLINLMRSILQLLLV
jgi:hypothetical protein